MVLAVCGSDDCPVMVGNLHMGLMMTVLIPFLVAIGFMMLWLLAFGLFPLPKAKTTLPALTGTRFCRDCANFVPKRGVFGLRTGLGLARCRHPTAMREPEDFLVRGYLDEDNMGYASLQRREYRTLVRFPSEQLAEMEITDPSTCGPQGRYWEQKAHVTKTP